MRKLKKSIYFLVIFFISYLFLGCGGNSSGKFDSISENIKHNEEKNSSQFYFIVHKIEDKDSGFIQVQSIDINYNIWDYKSDYKQDSNQTVILKDLTIVTLDGYPNCNILNYYIKPKIISSDDNTSTLKIHIDIDKTSQCTDIQNVYLQGLEEVNMTRNGEHIIQQTLKTFIIKNPYYHPIVNETSPQIKTSLLKDLNTSYDEKSDLYKTEFIIQAKDEQDQPVKRKEYIVSVLVDVAKNQYGPIQGYNGRINYRTFYDRDSNFSSIIIGNDQLFILPSQYVNDQRVLGAWELESIISEHRINLKQKSKIAINNLKYKIGRATFFDICSDNIYTPLISSKDNMYQLDTNGTDTFNLIYPSQLIGKTVIVATDFFTFNNYKENGNIKSLTLNVPIDRYSEESLKTFICQAFPKDVKDENNVTHTIIEPKKCSFDLVIKLKDDTLITQAPLTNLSFELNGSCYDFKFSPKTDCSGTVNLSVSAKTIQGCSIRWKGLFGR